MTLQSLEEKVKALAAKLDVEVEKVEAWFHTQADDLLSLAEDNLHLAHTVVTSPALPPQEEPATEQAPAQPTPPGA